MAFIYDLTDTWNAGGTTFNAIKMNVTDSASAAASKLVTLQVGGSERFGVRKDGQGYFAGNVGIGTSAPAYNLHVNASSGNPLLLVGGGANNTGGLLFGDDVGNLGGQVRYAHNVDAMYFVTSGNERMRIDSSGNVGIGTSAPASLLHLQANDPRITFRDTSGTSAATNYFQIGQVGANGEFCFLSADPNNVQANTVMQFSVDGSERMRIDSSGRVGVGVTSPTEPLDVMAIAGNSRVQIGDSGLANLPIISARNQTDTAYRSLAYDAFRHQFFKEGTELFRVDTDTLFQNGGTERMRIDSGGNLLVGKTTIDETVQGVRISGGLGFVFATRDGNAPLLLNRNTSNGPIASFRRDNVEVGTISVTTTATAYNTSSDYRLKDIDGPIQNSGAYIDALKPVQGSWKADGSRFIGLLAHEVQEVSETQIATGEKDGEEMQAMDYSAPEIIANLIAEVQSLRARVAQLEGN